MAIYADRLNRWGHKVLVLSTRQVVSVRHTLKSFSFGRGWLKPKPSYFDCSSVQHRFWTRSGLYE